MISISRPGDAPDVGIAEIPDIGGLPSSVWPAAQMQGRYITDSGHRMKRTTLARTPTSDNTDEDANVKPMTDEEARQQVGRTDAFIAAFRELIASTGGSPA